MSQNKHDLKTLRAEQLRARGLRDEAVLNDLLMSEAPNFREPRRVRAEMFDKMNHTCRKYTDSMIRMRFDYDFELNVEAFKTALIGFLERNPVFHSAFVDNHINPYWGVRDYNIDEVVSVVSSEDINVEAERFLRGRFPSGSRVQMQCLIVMCGGRSTVCFLVDHMCADGGDLKRFYGELCRNYSEYVTRGKSPIEFSSGPRGYRELYADFSKEDRKKAQQLFSNPFSSEKKDFPLTPRAESDDTVIVRKKIDKDLFAAARAAGKKFGASVNDVLAAACIYSVYDFGKFDYNEPLEISEAVNLRRHIKNPQRTGITNYTNFMCCQVPERGKNIGETLTYTAKSNKANKEDKFLGLYGIPLLNIAYKTMVYAQAEIVIRMVQNDSALLLFSNVGEFKPGELALAGHEPYDCFLSGGAKRKPSVVFVACTLNGELSIAACIKGNKKDEEMLAEFFNMFEDSIRLIAEQ